MVTGRQFYRLHDVEGGGCLPVDPADAHRWQKSGFGIFWTVNAFNGPRKKENLSAILAWAVDLDSGTKEEQRSRLLRSPVEPSLVVESARGYHAYWNALKREPIASPWERLVKDRLIPWFDADRNAGDVSRILRAPGYLHLKDPANPFPVRVVYEHPVAYSYEQMAAMFPDAAAEHREAMRREWTPPSGTGGDFWDAVWDLDCHEGLLRLSGHAAVGSERYTFKRTGSGTLNIVVDGKGTSCWVDKYGRIGSKTKGGPTLYQWLRWFGNSPGDCTRVLREIFPHLADYDRARR